MRFTDLALRALPFSDSQRDYTDDAYPGFLLRVGKRSKTFMVVVRNGDKRKRITLGSFPETTLSKAREKARAEAARTSEDIERIKFAKALEIYRTHCAAKQRPNTQKQYRRTLEKHFLPTLADRYLDDIRARHIVHVLDDLIGVPGEARNAFVMLRTFFNWAFKRGYLELSPIRRMDPPSRCIPRTRVLTPEELVAVWHACPATDYGDIVRLCVLSGQRIGQWINYSPDLIKGTVITWQQRMMKANLVHSLPLTPAVADILAKHELFTWTNPHTNKVALDKASGVSGWTHHDLRRTWATISAEELGTEPHIIEAVLAHAIGSQVARTYNRALYREPMRKALLAFEDWLQALLSNTESTNGSDLSGVRSERACAAE